MTTLASNDVSDLHESPDTNEVPDRSPSRIGFSRPPLLRSNTANTVIPPSIITSDDDEWDLEICTKVPSSLMHELDTGEEQTFPEEAFSPSTSFDQLYPAGRFNYCGLSRQHLADTRSYWDLRRRKWMEWQAEQELLGDGSTAYDGIEPTLDLEPSFPPSSNSLQTITDDILHIPPALYSPRLASVDPSAPIFPRLGDLRSLHDAHSVVMDRAFCNVPMYTIRKVTFLHEMLHLAPTDACRTPLCTCTFLVEEHSYPDTDTSLADTSFAAAYDDADLTMVDFDNSAGQAAQCTGITPGISQSLAEISGWSSDWQAEELKSQQTIYPTDTDASGEDLRTVVSAGVDVLAEAMQEISLEDESLTPRPTSRRLRRPKRKEPPKFFFQEDVADEFGFLDDSDESLYGEVMSHSISGPSAQFISRRTLSHSDMMYY
ncbi:hypothetical protein OBBRIDRAFT_311776 [Obba rivulosa]|uniref:Uncharacterized protein n=1 Tax=Obba rivulosa TaxID=1052685 RepID=A0A8E2ALB8_9APHY|nr:hypothetical protein OBBRIDRAFT_311776 [Obba rivulosa]